MARLGRGHPAGAYIHIVQGGTATTQPVSDGDTGTAAETTSTVASLTATDTGASVEAEPSVGINVTDGDTGTGADSASPGAQTVATKTVTGETGTGVETQSLVVNLSSAQTGTGVDNGTVVNAVTGAETGTFSEANNSIVVLASDTGTGVDVSTDRSFNNKDTGSLVDGQSLAQAAPTSADTAHGTEGQTIDRGAPDFRTLEIAAEVRTQYQSNEDRTNYVAAESREKVVANA